MLVPQGTKTYSGHLFSSYARGPKIALFIFIGPPILSAVATATVTFNGLQKYKTLTMRFNLSNTTEVKSNYTMDFRSKLALLDC